MLSNRTGDLLLFFFNCLYIGFCFVILKIRSLILREKFQLKRNTFPRTAILDNLEPLAFRQIEKSVRVEQDVYNFLVCHC